MCRLDKKSRMGGDVQVRFRERLEGQFLWATRLVLGFQHKEDALRFERVLKKRLEKFSLTLEPTKTQLVEFGRFADRNMKQKGGRPKTLYFLGFTFYCSKNRNGRFKVGMITEKTRLRRGFQNLKLLLRKNRHLPLRLQIRKINAFLAGHYNYYGLSGNSRAIRNIYYFAVKYWRKMLNSPPCVRIVVR